MDNKHMYINNTYLLKVDGEPVHLSCIDRNSYDVYIEDKNGNVTLETFPFNTEKTLCIRLYYPIKPKESYVVSTVGDSSKPWILTHIPGSPIKEKFSIYRITCRDCYFEKNIRDILIKKYSLNDKVGEEHKIVVHPEEANYFEELLKSDPSVEQREIENLQEIVNSLKEGNSVEMWVQKGLMRREIFT